MDDFTEAWNLQKIPNTQCFVTFQITQIPIFTVQKTVFGHGPGSSGSRQNGARKGGRES